MLWCEMTFQKVVHWDVMREHSIVLYFHWAMFLVLSLFCEYVLYIFLIMLVLSEVSENRVGLNARRKEISNLEIWKFSVNPNEHRIYS